MGFEAESLTHARTWRSRLRKKLRSLTGYDTMIKAPLKPKITEEVQRDGYRRQHVEIQTEPGIIMPMYVLIPSGANAPLPAVLCPHGHGSGGKVSVAGCHDVPGATQWIDHYNYDYGVHLARAGFITFCPDARGFGERREDLDEADLFRHSCLWISNMAIPLGQTVIGMWTWDLHRLVDYVQTRTDCLPGKIGCAGLSGGGMQTLWATALDNRIRCAVISGYFYGYKEALLDMHYNCSCSYVPHLNEYVDMGDLGALIAPRPLLIETGDKDELNGASGLKNVRPQVSIARKAYRLCGKAGNLKHDIFDGRHRWHGAHAIPWMHKHLA